MFVLVVVGVGVVAVGVVGVVETGVVRAVVGVETVSVPKVCTKLLAGKAASCACPAAPTATRPLMSKAVEVFGSIDSCPKPAVVLSNGVTPVSKNEPFALTSGPRMRTCLESIGKVLDEISGVTVTVLGVKLMAMGAARLKFNATSPTCA